MAVDPLYYYIFMTLTMMALVYLIHTDHAYVLCGGPEARSSPAAAIEFHVFEISAPRRTRINWIQTLLGSPSQKTGNNRFSLYYTWSY